MKVLHITPHLGGGVGKAHAAVTAALSQKAEQSFLLLEEPRDSRFIDLIRTAGAQVQVAKDLTHVAEEAADADIVQIEFWNHPRLFECLACCPFPDMRTVFWAHISGVSRPVIQPALIAQANRFVFSSTASLTLPYLAAALAERPKNAAVINSGFGFESVLPPRRQRGHAPRIAYLGTVDFVKMHPGFFSAIDALNGTDIRVSIWGDVTPDGPVFKRAGQMRHSDRIHFNGQTADSLSAMRDADIFFYPLQPDHYGTGENALIEAMSAGLVPVVLNNAAEAAIVTQGQTGFVCNSISECTDVLQSLLSDPDTIRKIGANAARHVATERTPALSARQFIDIWAQVRAEPAKKHEFTKIIGASPRDWFLATQLLPHEDRKIADGGGDGPASKGTFAHFAQSFPDADLTQL